MLQRVSKHPVLRELAKWLSDDLDVIEQDQCIRCFILVQRPAPGADLAGWHAITDGTQQPLMSDRHSVPLTSCDDEVTRSKTFKHQRAKEETTELDGIKRFPVELLH